MEDGLTEVQNLLHPTHNQEDGSKREDNKENKDGFVSIEKVEKVKDEDLDEKDIGKGCVTSDGGGIFNNFISSLVTPSSPRIDDEVIEHENGNEEGVVAASKGEHGEKRRVENSVEGGLISNFVSNFFHQSEGEKSEVENEKEKEKEEDDEVVEKIKRMKTEKEGNSGGGSIIHNIVSHLPNSLPDDAVPTADEATFLINTLVRD
ncbi:PREDICTED: uncharacterized protein LOC109360094 [Lupinus angustifolius]|uniref:uncharacterized protein LOC109360094 n=1 Tax=Lupinus angustifolius TaxID=3871 RepID=UPI00092E4D0A|nr:PREDICTED: uncharacterized protein LOC109360094 [Lupinus angustifolius]